MKADSIQKIKKLKKKISTCNKTVSVLQNLKHDLFYKVTDKIFVYKSPDSIKEFIEEKTKIYKRDKFELEKLVYGKKDSKTK